MNQCEFDRTQKQLILMLSAHNNRWTGFMLTSNHSMFIDNDGSIWWLYQCPKRKSPLGVLYQCYDRITINYNDRLVFVDLNTRQTYPAANEVRCVGDSFLSSTPFCSNRFKHTFGTINFYLEKIGFYFACFLCLKLMTDVAVAIKRAIKTDTISNKILGFWKIMLIFLSIM